MALWIPFRMLIRSLYQDPSKGVGILFSLVYFHPVNKWLLVSFGGEGNGTPLQYSCLENPMGRGAWRAVVHGVAKSRTRLNDFTFTFHFHALEKEMAIHSSVLAWRIPGTGEPGELPSMGSHRVEHDRSDLAAAAAAAVSFGRGLGESNDYITVHSCHNIVRSFLMGWSLFFSWWILGAGGFKHWNCLKSHDSPLHSCPELFNHQVLISSAYMWSQTESSLGLTHVPLKALDQCDPIGI